MKGFLVGFLALGILAGAAGAQRGRWEKPVPQLGLRGGYDYDVDVWSAGGQARWPLGRRGKYQLAPSGDVFFAEGEADWQGNVDLLLKLGPGGGIYFGAGLGYSNRPLDGERVVNRLIGLQLSRRLYIENRWTTVGGRSVVRMVVGYNFSLGQERDEAEGIFDARGLGW